MTKEEFIDVVRSTGLKINNDSMRYNLLFAVSIKGDYCVMTYDCGDNKIIEVFDGPHERSDGTYFYFGGYNSLKNQFSKEQLREYLSQKVAEEKAIIKKYRLKKIEEL